MKHLALSLWAILLSALCAPAHAAATESLEGIVQRIAQEMADGKLQQDIPDNASHLSGNVIIGTDVIICTDAGTKPFDGNLTIGNNAVNSSNNAVNSSMMHHTGPVKFITDQQNLVSVSSNVKEYPLIGDFPPLFTQPPSSVRAGIGGYIELPDLEEGNTVEEPQDYDQKYDEEQESDMPVLSMQGAEEEQPGINVVDSAAAPPDDSGTKAPR